MATRLRTVAGASLQAEQAGEPQRPRVCADSQAARRTYPAALDRAGGHARLWPTAASMPMASSCACASYCTRGRHRLPWILAGTARLDSHLEPPDLRSLRTAAGRREVSMEPNLLLESYLKAAAPAQPSCTTTASLPKMRPRPTWAMTATCSRWPNRRWPNGRKIARHG